MPLPINAADDRKGSKFWKFDVSKVVAVVETNYPDRNAPFKPPEEIHKRIAGHIIDFLDGEVKAGRLSKHLTPLQSGVGNIANAVLVGLNEGPFEQMTSYTEVVQDGMLDMLDSGKLTVASATAFSVSPEGQVRFNKNIDRYRKQIILRPQEISNNPEIIRRLGCIAMNGFVEADIYGHVNSTHIAGKGIENGIGGSGDFARNSAYTIFMSPATAKDGKISAIVPFASHIDHTEHEVNGIVTEYGFADLRGRSPKEKAKEVIEKCAAPEYRPVLWDYVKRAMKNPSAGSAGHEEPQRRPPLAAHVQRGLRLPHPVPADRRHAAEEVDRFTPQHRRRSPSPRAAAAFSLSRPVGAHPATDAHGDLL